MTMMNSEERDRLLKRLGALEERYYEAREWMLPEELAMLEQEMEELERRIEQLSCNE